MELCTKLVRLRAAANLALIHSPYDETEDSGIDIFDADLCALAVLEVV